MDKITFERFEEKHLSQSLAIWNEVIEEGVSFPGDKILTETEAFTLFNQQTETICLKIGDEIGGIYILHPNNDGRCSHISNASYAIANRFRGLGLGRVMVEDSIERAKKNGFIGLQFNAVVSTNYVAIRLYLSLGFKIIGTINNGFRKKDNTYCDTIIFLKSW